MESTAGVHGNEVPVGGMASMTDKWQSKGHMSRDRPFAKNTLDLFSTS